MQVQVNGEERSVPRDTTVAALLEIVGVTETRVAVEVNLEIVPKARYGEVFLMPGDAVEIVSFVGGG